MNDFPFSSLRVLPYNTYSGVFNMALDRYLADHAADDNTPVLRFYGWRPYCLSLGKHQKATIVDREKLSALGYDLVRRPTGGSAILHAEELTYSLIIPRIKNYDHHRLYAWIHGKIARSLNALGYPVGLAQSPLTENYLNGQKDAFACFNRKAPSEIQYKGKKVVGSAQKIYRHAILQHGSVMMSDYHTGITELLKWTREEKAEQRRLLKENSVALNEIKNGGIDVEILCDALLHHLDVSISIVPPTDEECDGANGLSTLFIV